MQKLVVLLLLASLALQSAFATSLPGFKKKTYEKYEEVPVFVNVFRSKNTATPINYYDQKIGICEKPDPKTKQQSHSNLGSNLLGERIQPSNIKLKFLESQRCQKIDECSKDLQASNIQFLTDKIKEDYLVNLVVDGLPAAQIASLQSSGLLIRRIGFNLGNQPKKEEDSFTYYNHYDMTIEYSEEKEGEGSFHIVGFLVQPRSVLPNEDANKVPNCHVTDQLILKHSEKESKHVSHYFSVEWKLVNTTYEDRWDSYETNTSQSKIHWLSLVDSTIIVVFLSFMVAMILLRALHKDIARYNKKFESAEDAQEDYGWKLVHADVFRTPSNPILLTSITGSGVQILLMSLITLALSIIVTVNHSIQPHLSTIAIVFYALLGFIAGYTSSRLYKLVGGESWKKSFLMTALFVPGILSSILVFLNFLLWGAGSSAAVAFGTLFGVLCLWILVSCPLSLLGSFIGFKRDKISVPVKTNEIARTIPYQTFYVRKIPSIIIGGVFPFSAIFIELYFILNSIWQDRYYYVFGFLFVTFILLCVTCCLSSILLCYFHLCSEDHYWWWRSFFTSGFSAFYAFAFATFYYYKYLDFSDTISTIIYFGWTFAMSFVLFVLTGTIGFLSCLWFVLKIYSAIRVD